MTEYGLPLYDASLLTNTKAMADYFESYMKDAPYKWPLKESAKRLSNWLLGEFLRLLNAKNLDIKDSRLNARFVWMLIDFVERDAISRTSAKIVFEDMFNTGKSAEEIIQERGLSQISDTGELEAAIADVLNSNEQAVSDYKAGKETALKFLVGQVMRSTKGRANPILAGDLLKKKLDES